MKAWIKYGIPTALWAAVIFWFSSQPYSKQDLRPFLSEHFHLHWVRQYFGNISFTYSGHEISVAYLGEAAFLEFFIRKGAHLFAFFMLGLLTCYALRKRKGNFLRKALGAFLFVSMYAASDEFHQMFTEGRAPLVADVGIDMVGGSLGIVGYYVFYKSYFRQLSSKNDRTRTSVGK